MVKIIKKISKFSNKVRILIINTLFWATVLSVTIFANYTGPGSTGSVLLIQPSGAVRETLGEDDILTMISTRDLPSTTLLKDLLQVIDVATTDPAISSIVLDLDFMTSIGFAQMEEIGLALEAFKADGKEIYAYASFYNQGSYYLASFADHISMDPFGALTLDGISVYRNYWKDTLDKYNVDVEIFRAGEYKSYVEPYLSNSMSTAVKRQNLVWMNSIWNSYVYKVSSNIDLTTDQFRQLTHNKLSLVKRYKGDESKLALDEGFVDSLETRGEFYAQFSDLNLYTDYLNDIKLDTSGVEIAVVTLEGNIVTSGGYNSINADETEALLDSLDLNRFKGLVLRINSGGGSAYASEVIRRKVESIAEVIPVVISMGDVCASGGYWIATAGDLIFADEKTITGSIGVFGMIFGFENTLEELLGVHNDGVSTITSGNPTSPTKNISSESKEIYQLSVENTYLRFLNLVAGSREMDLKSVKAIAGGRVWSGEQSLENGLVDNIGGLEGVNNYFIEELGIDSVAMVNIEQETPFLESLTSGILGAVKVPSAVTEYNMLQEINDPGNIFALWY